LQENDESAIRRGPRNGRQGGAGADYAITPAWPGVSKRVANLSWYDWSSSDPVA